MKKVHTHYCCCGCFSFLCFFPLATTLRNGGNVLVPCWPSVSDFFFDFLFICEFNFNSYNIVGNSLYRIFNQ